MITSEDVRRVTFDRTMRGYRCEDVDDYLKQVAQSMDALAADHEDMQKKLMVLAQRIDQYRAEENTLSTTMLNAQRLGDNVIKEAKQKAAEIIRAANIKAEDREQHARDEVELARQEVVTLKREADNFKKSLMDMYRKHIELLTKIPSYPETPVDVAAEEPEAVPEPEPMPEPEPAPLPVEEEAAPAPAPAPAVEYEQQQFGAEYYDPQPADTADEPIDTVEFAIAPPPEANERFAPGAGLYDLPPESAGGRTARPRSKKDDGLESFTDVDFDS